MSSTMTQNPSEIKDVDDDVKRAKEDNDPQTIFYLNDISADPTSEEAFNASKEDILTTLYSWATKIEHTVQRNLGDGDIEERHSLQRSWDRAAYRAKIVDYLAKTTPWLMMSRDGLDISSDETLTGKYHHDKLVYQRVVHEFLQENLPQGIPERLPIVERYIAETMVLGQDMLTKVLRFTLAFPLLLKTSPSVQSGLLVVMLSFEPKMDDESCKRVTISRSLYEARLNKKVFDQQKFDQNLLDIGKALVLDMTFDFTL